MLAIEVLVEEILRLQNLVCYLQAQLMEARKMNAKQLIHRMCAAPLVIQYEAGDELIHTDEHPYCDDPACGCHVLIDDLETYDRYINDPLLDGLLTQDEAARLFWNKQL